LKKPIVLCILDGFGVSETAKGNAVFERALKIDALRKNNPAATLKCAGMAVGLPDGQMGNSEVGHTNMGAGRVVYQELTRISKSIADGDFFDNSTLLGVIEKCKKNNTALHLIGLLSDGGVHSHNTHLYALLKLAKDNGLSKVFVHCLLDGRDVAPSSGAGFVRELSDKLAEIGNGKIGTVIGRYYAMDRDNRWERVEKAYAAMVYGEGVKSADPAAVVEASCKADVTDEFVLPAVIDGFEPIKENDGVIFFNFRPDRAREITRTFVDPDFDGFERKKGFFPVDYVCMTQYDAKMPNVSIAFKPQSLENTFGEYLSKKGLTQLRIAETEKYAHVTFFFNGGVEQPYDGEDRALIPSPKVATYDLKPEMSAPEVCDEAIARIKSGKYDVIILNFANCDMVGHTGVYSAAAEAVTVVDNCTARIVDAVREMGGITLITADHGNADKMYDTDGSPFTAHTTNPVPFIVCGKNVTLRDDGKLSDIAPTMLELIGLDCPMEMDGKSLLR